YSRCIKWCTVSCFNIVNSSRRVMDRIHDVIHAFLLVSIECWSDCLHQSHGRCTSFPVYIPLVNCRWSCASTRLFHSDSLSCALPRLRRSSCGNSGTYPTLNATTCVSTTKTKVAYFIFDVLDRLVFEIFQSATCYILWYFSKAAINTDITNYFFNEFFWL